MITTMQPGLRDALRRAKTRLLGQREGRLQEFLVECGGEGSITVAEGGLKSPFGRAVA